MILLSSERIDVIESGPQSDFIAYERFRCAN